MADKVKWRNRIVGHGEEDVEQIMFNPHNWRIHPKLQQVALDKVLSEVGWVQNVIINKRTGNLVDGHLRCQLAARNDETSVPVVYVDLSEEEELVVLSTIDPLSAMAGTDKDKLRELIAESSSVASEQMADVLEGISEQYKVMPTDVYTWNIEAPLYEPKGEQPELAALCDIGKRDALVREIDAAEIPGDVKQFLREAANRHVCFHYERIAEYYTHAPAEVQRLMENSALVIIDIRKAISMGYARVAMDIAEQYLEEVGDGS